VTVRRILVLASASAARARLLQGAGIEFVRHPACIDESAVKAAARESNSPVTATAAALAEAKAMFVSQRRPGAFIIGADQILECDGEWFDKAADYDDAVKTLKTLRNRTHQLVAAVAVVLDGVCVWQNVETAQLTMRPFTDSFLRNYMDEIGPDVLETVGAYRLEGAGVQLFSRIDGSFFTILGLPLLPLLEFLRREGVITH
jgi:septum formation protein